ncbi:MAG TPA: HEPN domain-containing protein [Gemmataceae bacterium]|nr:HEPN domain-containing protein [Gemmataceae bacterium]
MDFRDFLTLADNLVNGVTEAEWRSACSRGYYAAFHVARRLLLALGFRVPQADRAHAYLWLRLSNAGVAEVTNAGGLLNDLRRERNWADYDDRRTITQAASAQNVRLAEQIIQALDAAAVEPVRTQITDAMKVYERDVLHDVTWHP